MRSFSYDNLDSPALKEAVIYSQKALAKKFEVWLARRDAVRTARGDARPALRREYEVWWNVAGPVNFTSSEDTRRYKEELWKVVNG